MLLPFNAITFSLLLLADILTQLPIQILFLVPWVCGVFKVLAFWHFVCSSPCQTVAYLSLKRLSSIVRHVLAALMSQFPGSWLWPWTGFCLHRLWPFYRDVWKWQWNIETRIHTTSTLFCLFMILCYIVNVVHRPTGRMCNVHFNLASIWSKANVKRNRLRPLAGWGSLGVLPHPFVNIDCNRGESNSITRIELRTPEALSCCLSIRLDGFPLALRRSINSRCQASRTIQQLVFQPAHKRNSHLRMCVGLGMWVWECECGWR